MFSPLITFLIAGLISPGPNVIMLTGSGARFGVRAKWPHLLGVVIGTGVIGGVCGLGIGAVIASQPQLRILLQCVSFVWILWMAYRLLFPKSTPLSQEVERPWTFVQGAVFQWVNPKIVGFIDSWKPSTLPHQGSNSSKGLISGALLSTLLNNEKRWFTFRAVMAGLLAVSAIMVFL